MGVTYGASSGETDPNADIMKRRKESHCWGLELRMEILLSNPPKCPKKSCIGSQSHIHSDRSFLWMKSYCTLSSDPQPPPYSSYYIKIKRSRGLDFPHGWPVAVTCGSHGGRRSANWKYILRSRRPTLPPSSSSGRANEASVRRPAPGFLWNGKLIALSG